MRYALGVEYDGSEFQGWQQLGESGGPSVQATLQAALSSVADAPVSVVCAGRTDAGVHGECQVVHFDCAAPRPARGWMLGATARLPPSVCVRWCVPVADDFHARFSARARRYRYRLLNRQVRPALYRQTLSWERRPLQAEAMHAAAQALLGEQDFSAFRSVQCQALHARRELQSIAVSRSGELVEIQVQANAFLHHMVRNIVGSLVMVGTGEKPASWIGELLAGRDRRVAGPTAPPQGLVFVGPLYPAHWTLPDEVTL
ncbi:tRNA pseudouridine(38-40) synthase TruA [Xanthomonas rydalmerensis]|uniref:tRNA pseudouridine synthase A n=1 Tax=Xanthomonas rydalmerensis TaxID=3046274 RepID=A0ABZ0JKP1_9XANT|nr:tRNA pseudouridine(38-40) synthase TruA [Xanthomonas sp. DM-2023]WOS39554.1 tRNA pseudouridine(38-40) synthase TruA [Xanthomonas sp. DM-2023]WOS43738.1 tRNA pseudouridine(38-40) synthase TruA [Xanthomonas sp. DM-2023]WOS47919.1 tRNA pseudouridine(38-40) synthase TruA [Xanthomonas sp. DM-2023]WOS52097.1 tRNA pseudouridine(38-40) synthase TruA [Xanthomonas sp. DM-2023]WOS56281.1 tRNA pseudouridine(38-40) synthase TruA [Xanthomonas sp. DM-2023]